MSNFELRVNGQHYDCRGDYDDLVLPGVLTSVSRHDLICRNTLAKSVSNFNAVVNLFEQSTFSTVVGTLDEDPTATTAVDLCTFDNTVDDHATNPADPTYERPFSLAMDNTCSGVLPCFAPMNTMSHEVSS